MVAIALLAGITYYYTGSAGESTLITILFNAGGTLAYYGLERLWESVPWGRGSLEPMTDLTGGGPARSSSGDARSLTPSRAEADSEDDSP